MITQYLRAALMVISLTAMGCAPTIVPERLSLLKTQLARPSVRDMGEEYPRQLALAREFEQKATQALEDGRPDVAELHAWSGWQRLQVAENLEAIAHKTALAQGTGTTAAVTGAPTVAQPTTEGASEPLVAQPEAAAPNVREHEYAHQDSPEAQYAEPEPPMVDRRPAPFGSAAAEVQEAEDAQLRVMSVGAESDVRMSEANALLKTAQRALDRRQSTRAITLARRAALVFEVIRLHSRVSNSGGGSGGGAPVHVKGLAAMDGKLLEMARLSPNSGCADELSDAGKLMGNARSSRNAGQKAEAEEYLRLVTAKVGSCERRLVAERREWDRFAAAENVKLKRTVTELTPRDVQLLKARMTWAQGLADAGDFKGARLWLVEGSASAVRDNEDGPGRRERRLGTAWTIAMAPGGKAVTLDPVTGKPTKALEVATPVKELPGVTQPPIAAQPGEAKTSPDGSPVARTGPIQVQPRSVTNPRQPVVIRRTVRRTQGGTPGRPGVARTTTVVRSKILRNTLEPMKAEKKDEPLQLPSLEWPDVGFLGRWMNAAG